MSDINAAAGSGQYNITMPTNTGVRGGIAGAADVMNIIQGLSTGGFKGDVGAALGAADLANRFAGANIPYLGPISQAMGLVEGVKQGGVQGYTTAAADAAGLYAAGSAADVAAGGAGFAGASIAGGIASGVGIPLAFYGLVQMMSSKDSYNMADFQQDANVNAQGSRDMAKPYAQYANYTGTNPQFLLAKQTYWQYMQGADTWQGLADGTIDPSTVFAPGSGVGGTPSSARNVKQR